MCHDADVCALYVRTGFAAHINNSHFEHNHAGTDAPGGALAFIKSQESELTFCAFDSNFAAVGGALSISDDSSAKIHACTFTSNVANFR